MSDNIEVGTRDDGLCPECHGDAKHEERCPALLRMLLEEIREMPDETVDEQLLRRSEFLEADLAKAQQQTLDDKATIARLKGEVKALRYNPDRRFPLQKSHRDKYPDQRASCPWWVAEIAYGNYAARYGKEQSLEQLAKRAGFSNGEMDMFAPGWREKADRNIQLEGEVKALQQKVAAKDELLKEWHDWSVAAREANSE